MKLIDIDPILAWANDPEVHEPYGVRGSELVRKLWDAPTIDAVSVVRCKECIDFVYDEQYNCYGCANWNGLMGEIKPDGFCSYGEREGE